MDLENPESFIIENRGEPPYEVWSGTLHNGILEYDVVKEGQVGHKGTTDSFRQAIHRIFDISDAGNYNHGQYIKDTNGDKVFDLSNPNDLELLKGVDRFGLHRVEFNEA